MQSGDEATNNLRKQLADVQAELEALKIRSKEQYEGLQAQLTAKHREEMEALKEKYERQIIELQDNASNDKEFI